MVGQVAGRTFVSYSRKDGAEFAADLRRRLEREHLSVWQDIVALEGGRDWWSQIEDALKSRALQHFILVVTPAALESPYVRREVRLARQEGKAVCPVKGPGLGDLAKLPRWLGQIYDLDLAEHRTTLIRVLQDESRQKRVPMMAPEPPLDFVQRPAEFNALKGLLLDAKGDSVAAITAALRGAGGYGKTTMAKALAHDADIQDAYFDGILWAELGEKPERLLSILSDLITLLAGERPALETINAAAAKLGEALGDRRVLMVIDDAWREQDLRPFLRGGPNTVRLVTTRIDSILPATAIRQPVDAMQAGEAPRLLAVGLPPDDASREGQSLAKLAARLGKWAQLLKIANGFLRDRVVNARQPLSEAIAGVNKRLDVKGLVAFDPRDETDRSKAIARTLGVSLDLLSEPERLRFGELAVFPEDANIPIGVAVGLWAATGGFEDFETEDLLSRLFDLSLFLNLDLGQRFFRLHDTVRHFLRDRAGRERLVAQQKVLVTALDGVAEAAPDAPTLRYFYLYLPHHLAAADEREKLDALLLDPGWLKAKLEATANPQALVADYQQFGAGEAQNLIGRTLRLISGICGRDRRQLPVQLATRLASNEAVAASGFLDNARQLIPRPAIVPLRPSLIPPGAETARLEGHEGPVEALCVLPDGRLASGSYDKTIRLWDLTAGIETTRLEGSGSVNTLCLLPDGRLASGSGDHTIRLWDVKIGVEVARFENSSRVNELCSLPHRRFASGSEDHTIRLWDVKIGVETARLTGHTRAVGALCLLPDGRLASGSWDNTIRLWDLTAGAETARLEGHSSGVLTLCALPDERLASGSGDNTIRLWDVKNGLEVACFENSSSVNELCPLPDGRLASGSEDRTIRLWDLKTGAATARLAGHTGRVRALCPLPDGRLASGSEDQTIRLWDLKTGAETARLAPDAAPVNPVNALCMLPDGRLASGSGDGTIRLWDTTTGAETARLEGHTSAVIALCLLTDSRLASGSLDHTIRLWDVTTGSETARLAADARPVNPANALCMLPDGRLASGCRDRTIRVWDVAGGAETTRFNDAGRVYELCLLPDGRLASGSSDGKIRLWDVTSGAETARLAGHTGSVNALRLLPDGRLASGSGDRTIRLWDGTTGAETVSLDGHAGPVLTLCSLPDGRLASGSEDKTIRLWDVKTGAEIACLETDAPIACLLALSTSRLVAGDSLGRLHWLEVVD